jgi:hypothetical protein
MQKHQQPNITTMAHKQRRDLPLGFQPGVNYRLNNPPNLSETRQQLFALDSIVTFNTGAEFNTYFPYVSNVWSYSSRRQLKEIDAEVSYYDCRLRAKTWVPKKAPKPGAAHRTIRDGSTCDCSMKVYKYTGSGKVRVERVGESHTHDLDHIDQVKRNDGLKSKVLELIVRDIPAADILSGLQGAGVFADGRQQLVEAGGNYLTRVDINGWAKGFKKVNPDLRLAGRNDEWRTQFDKACTFLSENNWKFEELTCARDEKAQPQQLSHGVVFQQCHRLEKLRCHGRLVLMDSTHKTNLLGWYLYTLMVRDRYDNYIPCAHLLTDGEDSNILSAALCTIKRWCRNLVTNEYEQWEPRYFLTDDSAAEQLAIKKAFRGMYELGGEIEVKHLLCQVCSD